MNLCSSKELLLWDIRKNENEYTMCIGLKAFYQLRPIVRKTGTRVVILQRMGLPFFVPVILARKIFCIGLILCVAFWIGSGYFVWDIQCNGNYQITDDILMTFMKQNHVCVGMKKADLDIEELEKAIRKQFNQITWTSAKLDGTKLTVEIKENDVTLTPAIRDNKVGKDLVSDYDGTVVSMIVRSGVPKVAIGDAVTAGSVLVEGRIPIYNEDTTLREYLYTTADADIMIRYQTSHNETLPFNYIKKEYTGREKRGYYLRFGEKEFQLADKRPFLIYDSLMREQTPEIFVKFSIPIIWGTITSREYLNVEYEYTLLEAKEQLTDKMNKYIISLEEKGVQIIEKNVRIDTENERWIITADLTVDEPASKLVDTTQEDAQPDQVQADAVE